MDLHKIISELQSEKQRLDEAIQALERLSSVASTRKRAGPLVRKQTTDPPKIQGQGYTVGS